MAIKVGKTGTFNISTHNTAISGYVEWKETYDDSTYSATNESTIAMDVYLHRTNIYSGDTSLYGVAGTRIAYFGSEEVRDDSNLNLSIAGNSSSSGGPYTKVFSASKTIKHSDDGSKTITLGYYMTNSYAVGSASNAFRVDKTTSSVTLTTIPRASEVSSSSPYIGDNATIIISSKSSSFLHTLTYAFGSASGTITDKTKATTIAWDTNAIKSTLYAQIPNAKSGSGTITCQTYNGDTLVGTKSTTFNLYAKESDCKPSISGTVVDTNSTTTALTGDSTVMVRYMSKPKVTISASAKYSSSIKSYSINVDGQTSSSSQATFDTITSNSITISVTDSRGYSNSTTLKPSMINYVKLTSNLTIERPEQTSSEAYLNGSGQWFNGNFSSSNANTLTITAKYRKSGDSSWTSLGTLTPTKSGNSFTFSNLKLGSSFDYKNEYQFQITIADRLQTIGNQTKDIVILSTGKAIVRIGKEEVIVNGNLTVNEIHRNGYDYLASFSDSIYNGDANDYTRSGMYYLGSNAKNAPASAWVKLYVNGTGSSSSDISQLAFTFGNEVYFRLRNGSTWKEWKQIIVTGEPLNVPESRGSWNYPTKGAITVKSDNSGAQHSAIVGLKSDGASRLYGMDLLDSDSSPQMRFYAGSGFFSIDSNGSFAISGASYGFDGETRIYGAESLYGNTSGSNGTITLNKSSANFDYIEIFFKDNNNREYSSSKIAFPNGKTTDLFLVEANGNTLIRRTRYTISETTIAPTISEAGYVQLLNNENYNALGTNYIYITRVIGYK